MRSIRENISTAVLKYGPNEVSVIEKSIIFLQILKVFDEILGGTTELYYVHSLGR